MALEASIVERLQELRRWQVEQQERLLQHQQEQRETLSREQVRMYQALGLSVQNTSVEETKTEPIFQDSLEDSPRIIDTKVKKYQNILKTNIEDASCERHLSPQRRHELLHDSSPHSKKDEEIAYDGDQSSLQQCILPEKQITAAVEAVEPSTNVEIKFLDHYEPKSPNNAIDLDTPKDVLNNFNSELLKSRRITPEILIDGIKPLPLDKPVNKSLMIDDIPVPSPKKDFNTLLEERLRESQHAPVNKCSNNKIKRPFLKKGQGLTRFRLGTISENSTKQIRPRTMSLPSTVRMETAKGLKNKSDECNDGSKVLKKRTIKTDKAQKKPVVIPTRAQSRLSLKNVQPPGRIRSKSMCSPHEAQIVTDDRLKQTDRFNISDIESKTKRELEEVRIFELLEEKAENSSFCSTSSTVVALMQQSVQSTPLKTKSMTKNTVSTLSQNWRNETADDSNEDLLLAEIVYTTQSNSTVHNSSMTYKKQYQSDFGSLGRSNDPGPEISDENSTDNICELPYGTDIDPNYGADFPRNDEANYVNDKDFDRQVNFEKNTSLHVRFSEYNEYKTLTDTSTISNESETQIHYSDQRAWSDCSVTTDSSDAEEFTPMIQNDKNKDQGSLKNKSKSIQSKEGINERSYNNRYYNDQFHKEQTEAGQRDDNCSDSEIESEEKRYNYREEAAEDVFESGSEQNDDNENAETQNEVTGLADSTLIEEESDAVKTQEENGLIFKSELLKTRLLELEQEIEIFRKENIAVSTLKEKLQEERRVLERNFKEKENRFEERRLKLENNIQEEKKKLMREKTALENRLKDAHVKAQQSKQERLEVQSLRDQLEELKEDMNQKESRWNAAQARHRSQVRILQSENSKLKQDIEKLQNTRKTNTKARLQTKHVMSSNTKAIHQINKQLESQKQPPRKQNCSSDEEEFSMQPMMEAMNLNKPHNDNDDFDRLNADGSKMIIYDRTQAESKNRTGSARKRDLYENLLKDATMGLKEGVEATKKAVQSLEDKKNSSKSNQQLANPPDEIEEDTEETCFHPKTNLSSRANEFIAESTDAASEIARNVFTNYTNRENYIASLETARNKQQGVKTSEFNKSPNSNDNIKTDKQGIREVQHPDGRMEFWYPNGNVKKISADGTTTKLIYYNGDVCESRKDGSVKYFYATTRTWHTTMSDGLEILEFPDGQVERRSKDGTVEVSFPDGSVRILQTNGTEKWALPDGTLAETSADGEKVLTLPNGQREVHTKDHKRREYPDGTVKLVYPDGSQETRYAGGRVRLKDKDGNLLMDSHQ